MWNFRFINPHILDKLTQFEIIWVEVLQVLNTKTKYFGGDMIFIYLLFKFSLINQCIDFFSFSWDEGGT